MKIKINSANEVMYNCCICGKKLNKYDYCKADDMCSSCRSSSFRPSNYYEKDGSNKIDMILVDKIKKTRR